MHTSKVKINELLHVEIQPPRLAPLKPAHILMFSLDGNFCTVLPAVYCSDLIRVRVVGNSITFMHILRTVNES